MSTERSTTWKRRDRLPVQIGADPGVGRVHPRRDSLAPWRPDEPNAEVGAVHPKAIAGDPDHTERSRDLGDGARGRSSEAAVVRRAAQALFPAAHL